MNTNVILSDKAKEAKQLIQEHIKHKIFIVHFVKANGEVRRMRAQWGTKKGVKGWGLHKPEHIMTVKDRAINDFRSFDLERIVSIDCGKLHWKAEK